MGIIDLRNPLNGDRVLWPAEAGPFPHLARIIDLPPLTAQAAFDAVRLAHSGDPPSRHWAVSTTESRLELSGPGQVPSPPRPCYWPLREVPGKIRSHRWHLAIPVRLLLVPWSATRTAVAVELRPPPWFHAGRQPWLYAAENFYVHAGHDALRALAAELEAWGLSEARELDTWLDSLVID